MKIALANNYYYVRGGSERVLFDDHEALTKAGHDVRPFSQKHENNVAAASEAFFPEIAPYTTVGPVGLVKAAFNVVYSPSVGNAFATFLDDFRPDLVHCHNIYGHLTTAILDEAKRRGIPVVMTVHDQKLVCPAYLALRQGKPCQLCSDGGYWRCARWKCHKESRSASLVYMVESYFNRWGGKYDAVAKFLCPSRFMQNSLIGSGISANRTIYHPNALAPEAHDPEYEPGDYALYAGRLSAEKGLMTLIAAFKDLGIPLRIAGTGPIENQMRDVIGPGNGFVRLEGYCSGERLAQLYRNSAFTVVPSECYENASMAILESFAFGKPVLASDIGGNPELVTDGETGHLFSAGNVAELAEAVRKMWIDRDGLRRKGRRARALIESKFNQRQRITDLVSIYRAAME